MDVSWFFSLSHLFDDRMVAGYRGPPSRTWSRMPSGVSLGAEGLGMWNIRKEGFEYHESHPLSTLYILIPYHTVNYELHWITFKFLLNASHHPPSMIQIHIGPSNGVFKIMGRGWTGIPGWVSESPGGRAVGHQVFERGAGHPGQPGFPIAMFHPSVVDMNL